MTIDRRGLFARGALALAAGAAVSSCARAADPAQAALERLRAAPAAGGAFDWADVRALFPLTREWIDMSAMLITSHPKPVADAIDRHRRALDENPVLTITANNGAEQRRAQELAGRYMGGVPGEHVALTDSTTQGVALVYHGLRLRPGQEVLTSEHDYYVTHESLRLAAARNGATVRRITLHDGDATKLSADAIVDSYRRAIGPKTRVLALTWVHSSTGLKIPPAAIGDMVRDVNRGRDEDDRVLVCLDSVHGFGNQDEDFGAIGADFVMAGCHKWLFGPRGTGVVLGSPAGWAAVDPTIPTFLDSKAYRRWMRNEPPVPTLGTQMTPGGFKAFEHLWALGDAFELAMTIGRARTAARTAELAGALKDGLASIPRVKVQTPRSPALSAGIVSFDVDGANPWEVVEALRGHKLIASVAPYRTPHVRLTPSIRNSPDEIDAALRAVRAVVQA